MKTSAYLRRQADNCLRIARVGFDLETAERLRHMAADLQAKADELDEASEERGQGMAPHMMGGNGSGHNSHGPGGNDSGGNGFERG